MATKCPDTQIIKYSINQYWRLIKILERKIKNQKKKYECVYGIPRGGLFPAVYLSHQLDIPLIGDLHRIPENCLLVDDVYETGRMHRSITMFNENHDIAVLVHKKVSDTSDIILISATEETDSNWIQFPYEQA